MAKSLMPATLGDLLKMEVDSDYTRDVAQITPHRHPLPLGTVLGRLRNGEYSSSRATDATVQASETLPFGADNTLTLQQQNVSNVVLTSADGTIPYVLTDDYTLAASTGTLTRVDGGTIEALAEVKVEYTYTHVQDGSEVACAVLLQAVPPSEEKTEALILSRGPVIVAERALHFDASVNTEILQHEKTASLIAYGIVARA